MDKWELLDHLGIGAAEPESPPSSGNGEAPPRDEAWAAAVAEDAGPETEAEPGDAGPDKKSKRVKNPRGKMPAVMLDAYPEARRFLAQFRDEHLRFYRDECYTFDGRKYVVIPDAELRAKIARHLETRATHINRNIIGNVLECVRAEIILSGHAEMPLWLGGSEPYPADETLATAAGLLHVPSQTVHPLTPDFFAANAVGYAYDRRATCLEVRV